MVQAVSAAGVSSCSVGVSLVVRDLLRTPRPRWRRDSAHSSCCSASTAPTRRIKALRSGKIPTTSVRRISLLSRSWGLFKPDLSPDLLGERGERQQVRPSLLEVGGDLRELVSQCTDDPII